MDETQRKGIRAYVDRADRGTEPLFVGRGDLFEAAASAARACADGHPQGQTLCLSGPPGVGKTAFIEALRGRSLKGGWGGPPTLVARVPATMLHNPHVVLRRLAEALPEAWCGGGRERILDFVHGLSRRGGGVTAFGAGAALGAAPAEPEGDPLGEGLAEALRGVPKGAAVCLAVDEAQRLKPTPGGEANELLANVHAGEHADFPLFVLLAGHSQTPDIIQPSVSRRLAGRRAVRMQPLSGEEARTYLAGVMDHLGLLGPAKVRRRLIDWLAAECGGFPHHLRSAMTALGAEMLRADSARPGDLDAKRVAADLAGLRVDYYQGRLSGLRPALPVIRELLGDWGPAGISLERAEDDARALLARMGADMRAELRAAGMGTGPDLVGAMVSRGLLAADAGGERWRCLIPSLRQYVLTGTFRTRPPPKPMDFCG